MISATAAPTPSPTATPTNTNTNNTNNTVTTTTTTTIRLSSSPASASASASTPRWLPSVHFRSGRSRVSSTHRDTTPRQTQSLPPTAVADRSTTTTTATTTITTSAPRPHMRVMTRNRSETVAPVLRTPIAAPRAISSPDTVHDPSRVASDPAPSAQLPTIRFSPHADPRAKRPSLVFPSITRTIPTTASVIRVGRYSERDSTSGFLSDPNPPHPSAAPVGFKSKVVSRRHCEFWCQNAQWYIKDVGSSSGTFLNHIRLSLPGVESRPYNINDGDVVQLGIDFRGGEEMIFRCVKIRVECNRGWQKGLNNFNKQTHKRLKSLARNKPKVDGDTASTHSSECSICLMAISPCQSLFVASCSHVWHYKCVRPIIEGSTWPNFLCPNCRAVADLNADVDDAVDWSADEDEDMEVKRAIEESLRESQSGDGEINGGSSEGRVNGDGDAMCSLDVTNAAAAAATPDRRTNTMPQHVDATADARSRSSSRSSSSNGFDRGRTGYGQGLCASTEPPHTPRTPHAQRGNGVASTRSLSAAEKQRLRSQHDTITPDAGLAALVHDMNLSLFAAPERAPPPPPLLVLATAAGSGDDAVAASCGVDGGAGLRDCLGGGGKLRAGRLAGQRDGSVPPVSSPVSPEPCATSGFGGGRRGSRSEGDGEAEGGGIAASLMLGVGSGGDGEAKNRRSMLSAASSDDAGDIGAPDCPMTPRNDAGPFILDGSGGR